MSSTNEVAILPNDVLAEWVAMNPHLRRPMKALVHNWIYWNDCLVSAIE